MLLIGRLNVGRLSMLSILFCKKNLNFKDLKFMGKLDLECFDLPITQSNKYLLENQLKKTEIVVYVMDIYNEKEELHQD